MGLTETVILGIYKFFAGFKLLLKLPKKKEGRSFGDLGGGDSVTFGQHFFWRDKNLQPLNLI